MQTDSYWENQWEEQDLPTQPHNNMWVLAFLAMSLIACMAAAVLVPGGLGFIVGYQELQVQNHEAAIVHFNRGLGYLAEDYPELAHAEFEVALKYDATYAPAQDKLNELDAKIQGKGTPVPQQADRVAAALFDEASDLYKQKQWSDAITRLEQLRTLQADYRKAEVSDLLFQAYVNGGKAAVGLGQIELARERFESALTIRDDAEAKRQRDLAVLYLDGQQAVGYSWKTAVEKFAALYQRDPNYNDIKVRLFDAYVNYGDLAMKQNASCLAVTQYDKALAITNDVTLAQRRAQSMTLCKQAIGATLTPVVGPDNYNRTISVATNKPCNGTGDVSGVVRDALGRLLPNVPIGYYADGISLTTARTNENGQYQFVLGKDPGLIHVIVLSADWKTPAGLAADVQYPGGTSTGCHIVVDWQRMQ